LKKHGHVEAGGRKLGRARKLNAFTRRAVGAAQFDRLYAESVASGSARVMAVSVHPYITGVAHRIGWLEKLYAHIASKPGVLMWTGESILDWYLAQAR